MIKVLHSGFYSTIQDFGRTGFQEFGVPYSGVMDRKAATLANTLLGNRDDEAVLEMTMTGAKLLFVTETCIAICGADISPKLNNETLLLNRMIQVKPNDILSFGKLNTGFRCYLAVLGGFKTETIMKSKSMYQNITKQFMIYKNDELQISQKPPASNKQHASMRFDSSYINSNILEVYKGPEFENLTKNKQTELFSKPFVISKDNNRMAYQLEETFQNNLSPIITSAVLPGTVQLTPSGKFIILMRDCQTTGGYPRVLQLKESSMDVLSQKFAGNTINFKINSQY
ncbi:MAG: biotin-dependent carboxyltransferase family protein [Flavobacteriaceae bacterium]|mgnify:CR=1 FL=1|tara:strand:- start:705 stop:1559 length:855 start_codon:yes stop_codon:yes gene_type:complete